VLNPDDDDEVELILEVRTSVNDGYTSMVQYLGRSHPDLVSPYIPEVGLTYSLTHLLTYLLTHSDVGVPACHLLLC
jgi:hypothetical protein